MFINWRVMRKTVKQVVTLILDMSVVTCMCMMSGEIGNFLSLLKIMYRKFFEELIKLMLCDFGFILWVSCTEKKFYTCYLESRLRLLKKLFHVIPINSSFLCRRVLESSTQIQDRLPRLSLEDLFKKKPLQIKVGTRI